MSTDRRTHFLQRADETRPVLLERICRPVGEVVAKKSDAAFQGWQLDPAPEPNAWIERQYKKSGTLILDFGEHIVGTFRFTPVSTGGPMDATTYLKLVFGEVPSEVCEPFDPYHGILSRGWLQDETFSVYPDKEIVIWRRLAFRYVKIEMVGGSFSYTVRFADISCTATTSADPAKLAPYTGPAEFKEIDAVAVRTLANCMQDVFEDGTKRDRRLWLGDLRLQALANQVTFKNYDLVRRCLYMLAAFAPEDNLIISEIYVYPKLEPGICDVLDYALLFTATLLEYAKNSGDWETARELFPLAKFQVDYVLGKFIDERGLFVDPKKYWLFIDWRAELHKETAVQGVMIYALGTLIELAERLGLQAEIPHAAEAKKKMSAAAKEHLRDPKTGFYTSGPDRQISWASHAWLIIAGVISPEEGRELLSQLQVRKDVVMPAGPYLYHYIVEAMFICGMKTEALELIRTYWGSMVEKGASTFWEVYDPTNDHLSPYENYHLNSYCHAWSCTPSYFVRRLS